MDGNATMRRAVEVIAPLAPAIPRVKLVCPAGVGGGWVDAMLQADSACKGGFHGLEDETLQAIKSVFMRLSHSLRRSMRFTQVYTWRFMQGLRRVYAGFTHGLHRFT
jgi:hypothetical protein